MIIEKMIITLKYKDCLCLSFGAIVNDTICINIHVLPICEQIVM